MGVDSEPYVKNFKMVIGKLVAKSTNYLSVDNTQKALFILEECDTLTKTWKLGSFPLERVMILNHLGCLYKRMGQLDKAKEILEKLKDIDGFISVQVRTIRDWLQSGFRPEGARL